MPVNRYWMPVIVIAALFGTVFAAQALGLWSTSGRTSIDMETMTPVDIKGWMTIQQVADGLHISTDEVYASGSIPADIPADTALKDLEGLVEGFETSILREVLDVPANPPVTGETDVTPEVEAAPTAMPVPITQPEVTPDSPAQDVGATVTPRPSGDGLSVDEIKGKMTLQQVSDQYVLDLSALLAALKLPPDTNTNLALKDLVSQGLLNEVSDVKVAVTALQGQ